MIPINKCRLSCIHGQCYSYVNNPNLTYCRCYPGWTGIQCNDSYTCNCALNSLCISKSICLCSLGQYGPRCYLFQSVCNSQTCMNNGLCLPIDVRYARRYSKKFMCICPSGYIGDRCEHRPRQSQIDISFDEKLSIPSSLLIHLIAIHDGSKHNRTSIMKKIRFDQYSLTLFVSVSFNIAFVEMFNAYYLIIVQEKLLNLVHISTKILRSHRCQSINELFNETFAKQHLLKRIKYYHKPCKEQLNLVCFYDDIHFCLCNLNHQANCFEFDYNMTYDCGGYNYCENNGHCLQDDLKCPRELFCACHQCYFGSKCQFSTKGSSLSLDTILGYHIHPMNGIIHQSIIVKVAITLTTIMFIFGLINSFLSFETFRRKTTHNVGCGLYLFVSSIISIIVMILFKLKFWFLLLLQIGLIDNHLFSRIQCLFLDFFLHSLLSINDWLSACIAIERTMNVYKGIKFDKEKSRKIAKYSIPIVICLIMSTYIYDPIHRHIMFDKDEQHTWCVSQYSSSVQIYDWLLNIFHFIIPFIINCISAIIIIFSAARTRSISQKTKSFKEHLREQIHHHKHLLISPLILIVLAVPRLIISFLSGCMESAKDSWFYLFGYFISFVPPIMTFVVFVLPSDVYKKEFQQSLKYFWRR